jgi:hypothetical protein
LDKSKIPDVYLSSLDPGEVDVLIVSIFWPSKIAVDPSEALVGKAHLFFTLFIYLFLF